jgi:hypothetical protein
LHELASRAFKRVHGSVGNHAHRNAAGRSVFGLREGACDSVALVSRHGEKFTAGA